jgi:GNAT superfamily N-acetyltransferase
VNTRIRLAETREEIARCFPVIVELRPHLEAEGFVEQVLRQQRDGYRLAYLEDAGEVRACAGYRFTESLSWGRFMYVDDLVTASSARSKGHGGELLDWLVAQAREQGCAQFHLDSGVQRFGAHRFYLTKRMDITAHHFALKL